MCTYGCSLEGAKEVMFVEPGGSVGGIVAMEKVSIFYTVDLKIFKTGFKKAARGRQ